MDFSPRRSSHSDQSIHTSIPIVPKKTSRNLPALPIGRIIIGLLAHLRHMLRKRLLIIALICLVSLVAIAQRFTHNTQRSPVTNGTAATSQELYQGMPTFTTYVPNGKSIKQLGGWTRVSPEGSAPVYAYSDTIDSTHIIVSQQALPDDFKRDTDTHVNELAQSYGADNQITARDFTVYVGTSVSGPQSAIFRIQNTLVLIKSASKLSNDQWIGYISSLK